MTGRDALLRDRHDLPLSTASPVARDAYVAAGEMFLAADPRVRPTLEQALAADPDFALAHMLRARFHQVLGEGGAARDAAARAVALAERATPRERSHVQALGKVVAGDRPAALAAIEAHLAEWPRDVLVLLPVAGVFGVFGFSGARGWEPRLLDFLSRYRGALGADWWYLAALAFAQAELGQIAEARDNVACALDLYPRNANAAHVRAHVHYEAGEDAAGLAWLSDWHRDYGRDGYMHCHLGWHIALWNLDLGRTELAWQAYETLVRPVGDDGRGAWGPPLNVLTDVASFLFRAELAGGERQAARWAAIAAYARARFPQPGLAFADVHAALAYAMAGEEDALEALSGEARGPAGDLVMRLVPAFAAFARADWPLAADGLADVCRQHERLGGSHAQRDMLEQALAVAAVRAGRPDLAPPRRR